LNTIDRLKKNLKTSIEAKQKLMSDEFCLAEYLKAFEIIIERYKLCGRLYIAGNGGSAADAQHLAAEYVSKLAKNRDPLPAEALTVDSSILTAKGNDYGFDQVFSRQLVGKTAAKDIFLGITTSG
jgi:D-sedoheptulose 7-phosphate isomerase